MNVVLFSLFRTNTLKRGETMRKKPSLPGTNIHLIVWSNIRKYQYLQRMTDSQLSDSMGVTIRTLYSYDKDPSNLTLEKIERFLNVTGIEMESLIVG